ncbi:DEAD/DEAH box helicase family protein [Clostridium ljungdahlii]|uniref:Uncharacterized protein n=1 Tax=Clostridium ljungdahlii TaxID=1538 RepID=A0A168MHG9_9CLOT|nr:DEAD/DEAH box helicase family protein [Clostridium ljungdahlii]OAA84697.1 hypothetical protein WY13_02596 [Clostridium ljungdahlii]
MVTERLENIINKKDKDLMKMINYISNPLIGLRSKYKFKVFTLETSRGKTIGTAYAIAKAIKGGSPIKYVFTTHTLEECSRVAELINKEVGENVAMYYNPSQKGEEKSGISSKNFYDCAEKQVLIVTHATYLNLCSPKNEFHRDYRNYIKGNFSFLIIDEEINAVVNNLCSYSDYTYKNMLKLIKSIDNDEILNLFDKLCEQPKRTIKFYENIKNLKNRIIVAEEVGIDNIFTSEEYNNLISLINSVDNEVINDYNVDNKVNVTKNEIIEEIQKINILCKNIPLDRTLYWNGTLYSCNFNFRFLMLSNNVLLDASAKFNKLYTIGNMFDVVKSQRIIDHSRCCLYWHNINTSKSAKKKNGDNNELTEWRKFIVQDIKKKARKDTKVLIITYKAECEALDKRFLNDEFKKQFKEYALLNFFNMRGVDKYAEYEECFIVHTHRFAFPIYVLMYMYYKKIDNACGINMSYGKHRGNNTVGFEDEILDSLLLSDEISALYQACKRICRTKEPIGNFHIYNNNLDVIKQVQKELLNVRIVADADNQNMKIADDFYFLISEIREGVYNNYKITNRKTCKKEKAVKRGKKNHYEVDKRLFYETLGIDNTHFSRDIANKVDEKELGIKFKNNIVVVNF